MLEPEVISRLVNSEDFICCTCLKEKGREIGIYSEECPHTATGKSIQKFALIFDEIEWNSWNFSNYYLRDRAS